VFIYVLPYYRTLILIAEFDPERQKMREKFNCQKQTNFRNLCFPLLVETWLICIPHRIDGCSGICSVGLWENTSLLLGIIILLKAWIFFFLGLAMQEIPINNPVYLMLGASFGSAAKGTGLKALEFALSICESVDMYGFTVDPGYKEWYKNFFPAVSISDFIYLIMFT
jgi:hypothetical protein